MKTTYVASGDFIVAPQDEPAKLVALLGTCVGVAIFDKKSKVSGICHILLPKPNDPANVWNPKNYASTALPLFVDELLQAGAKREELEAVVAGGSLCVPISSRDLGLNIGGLNLENTFQFLERHKIPVSHSETGGCHTMRLILEPEECKVEIVHSQASGKDANTISAKPHPPSNLEIEAAIEEIKPIPQIALKLITIIRGGDYHMNELIAELNSDQVLSAKLLGYCNSAFFGYRTQIDSVKKAVSLLGETYLLEAIISASVNSFFEQEQAGGYALLKGGLFKHSICVAHIARVLAKTLGKEDEHTAYTAGLLHDIGKIVLDTFVANTQHLFCSSEREAIKDLIQLEQKAFNCDHQRVGRKLAKRWKLPKNIREVIRYHHNPEKAIKARKLTHIVSVANVLAYLFMAGLTLENISVEAFDESLAYIGLKKEDIPLIIDQIPWNRIMYA